MTAALLLALMIPPAAPRRPLPAEGVPAVGSPAPDFSLPDQDGRRVTRASLLGKRAVLAFYPRDFTPG